MTYKEYLSTHDLTEESIKKYGITFDAKKNRIIIPVYDVNGKILFNKYRNLGHEDNPEVPKYQFDPGNKAVLYYPQSLASSWIIVTEGEFDAVRLLNENLPTLTGTAGAKTFTADWAKLFKDKKLYFCYDNDKAGKEALIKLAEIFPDAYAVTLPPGTKDVCEFFHNGHTKAEFMALVSEAKASDQTLASLQPQIPTITVTELLKTDFGEESWIIDRILPEESISMFVGEAGTFKSFMTLYLAKCLITGEAFLGKYTVNKKCRILILDKENKLKRVQKRLKGLGFPPTDNLFFLSYPEQFMFDDENESFQGVARFVKAKKIDLVVLDSFVDMFEGNENSAEDTAKAFNAIRRISMTASFIAIHHDSKPVPRFTKTAAQKTRGSSNIIAQLDTQFYLEKGKDGKTVVVEQGKSRDEEPIPKFIASVETDPDLGVTGFTFKEEFKAELKAIEEATDWTYSYIVDNQEVLKKDLLSTAEEFGFKPRIIEDAIKILKNKLLIEPVRKEGYGNKVFFSPTGNSPENEGGEQLDYEAPDPNI